MTGFVNIEDKDNWHGKPLGDKADEVVGEIRKRMKSNGGSYHPKPSSVDVPPVDLDSVKLSEPPKYALGEKVSLLSLN